MITQKWPSSTVLLRETLPYYINRLIQLSSIKPRTMTIPSSTVASIPHLAQYLTHSRPYVKVTKDEFYSGFFIIIRGRDITGKEYISQFKTKVPL